MIVNNTHEFIFVHVPKAAGSSLTRMLSALSKYNDIEIGGTPLGEAIQPFMNRRYGLYKHAPAWRIRDVVGEDLFAAYFKFGFVRNPFTRLSSIFHFLKSWDGLPPKWKTEMDRFEDFESFLASDLWAESPGPDAIFEPQVSWLCSRSDPSRLLVDMVGKLENFAQDVARVEKAIPGAVELHGDQHLNKSPKYTTKQEWDTETTLRVCERYKFDFEVFGYSQEPPV